MAWLGKAWGTRLAARLRWGSMGVAATALMVSAMLPAGCTTTEQDPTPGEECVGGIVADDGVCQPICDPAKCLEGNVCVDNACRLICDDHEDCWYGVQSCQPATGQLADGTEAPVLVCLDNGRQPKLENGYPVGWYGSDCIVGDISCYDPATGIGQLGCPNGLACDPGACADCELDEAACGDRELCNIGACASSGERCTFNTCAPEECKPFTCVGFQSEGDTTAYCSSHDCAEDAHCPEGFHCGVSRDPRPVCGTETGGGNVCNAEGDEACVDPQSPPEPGALYSEGSVCLMRNTCLLRDECAPCQTNLDCSLGRGDVCAGHVNDNVCLRFCGDEGDCAADETCIPYNPASGKGGGKTCGATPNADCDSPADCPVDNDVCVARNVCAPKSGACDGGNVMGDKFCAHCTADLHCGGPGSGWACVDQRGGGACLDLSFPNDCTTDGDCPQSPSGLFGECLDADEGVEPDSSVYHKCYFPLQADGFSCW